MVQVGSLVLCCLVSLQEQEMCSEHFAHYLFCSKLVWTMQPDVVTGGCTSVVVWGGNAINIGGCISANVISPPFRWDQTRECTPTCIAYQAQLMWLVYSLGGCRQEAADVFILLAFVGSALRLLQFSQCVCDSANSHSLIFEVRLLLTGRCYEAEICANLPSLRCAFFVKVKFLAENHGL